jgi:hypothetical protein
MHYTPFTSSANGNQAQSEQNNFDWRPNTSPMCQLIGLKESDCECWERACPLIDKNYSSKLFVLMLMYVFLNVTMGKVTPYSQKRIPFKRSYKNILRFRESKILSYFHSTQLSIYFLDIWNTELSVKVFMKGRGLCIYLYLCEIRDTE